MDIASWVFAKSMDQLNNSIRFACRNINPTLHLIAFIIRCKRYFVLHTIILLFLRNVNSFYICFYYTPTKKLCHLVDIVQIVDKSLYLFRKDIGFLLYIGNFRNEIVFFCIFWRIYWIFWWLSSIFSSPKGHFLQIMARKNQPSILLVFLQAF